MDELLSPYSSSSPPSPASFFSHAGHPVIELASCEVPEQWLLGDVVDVVAKNQGYYDEREELAVVARVGCTHSPASEVLEQPRVVTAPAVQRPAAAGKRRGRKPGPRPDGPSMTISHVEAERQRRDKLNRRFCDLRAAVPTVSRMDKASLLADAAAYITELRARVARLEAEAERRAATAAAATASRWDPVVVAASRGAAVAVDAGAVEARMVWSDAAAVRATSAAPHAPARLMGALRALGLHVQHASVSRVNGVTVQDVVVDVPAELRDDVDALRASLQVQMLHDHSGCSSS